MATDGRQFCVWLGRDVDQAGGSLHTARHVQLPNAYALIVSLLGGVAARNVPMHSLISLPAFSETVAESAHPLIALLPPANTLPCSIWAAGIAQRLESDSWSKGRGFESPQERRENFFFECQIFVLILISVFVPPSCYRSST